MPSTLSYPGVYIEEIPSGVRTIIGVPTSICAFVGRAERGPLDEPVTINGFGDFERIFGGLWTESRLGFSVRDFFRNGGAQAIIVRAFNAEGLVVEDDEIDGVKAAIEAVAAALTGSDVAAAAAAAAAVQPAGDATPTENAAMEGAKQAVADAAAADGATVDTLKVAVASVAPAWSTARLNAGSLTLAAKEPGRWGANLRARINRQIQPGAGKSVGVAGDDDKKVFNLTVSDAATGRSETFLNVTFEDSDRRLATILADGSKLVRAVGDGGAAPEAAPDPRQKKPGEKSLYDEEIDRIAGLLPTASDVDGLSLKTTRTLLAKFEDGVSAEEGILAAIRAAGAVALRTETDSAKLDKAKANLTAAEKEQRTVVDVARTARLAAAGDGGPLLFGSFVPDGAEGAKTGLYALLKADIFNLLVIPPYAGTGDQLDVEVAVVSEAAKLCEEERAFLIVDAPTGWVDKDAAKAGMAAETDEIGTRSKNAAIFFPRIRQPNPLREMRVETFTPSGVVAGVFARTDRERGVWKAPAGLDASLVGTPQLSVPLTSAENGELNPLGLNCLRAMPPGRRVVWGARTLEGDDRLASEWKYIPIRRLALFIEETLFRNTHWVVFEPNDEPLWASIRLNVGAFMNGLFRQGAFAGRTPQDAYFVRCDKETNPQEDIDRGIVNILVGFAPLKPAEFVVIKLQQMAGQLEA